MSLGLLAVLAVLGRCGLAGELRAPLEVKLDTRGPYLILATKQAEADFASAIAAARELHPDPQHLAFDPTDLETVRDSLQTIRPRYVLLFVKPDELDVNFAWRWLTLATQLDDDPFVDLRTGFITGDTPASAEAFVRRIAAAIRGESAVPARLVDNLGPNTQAGANDFYQSPGSFFLSALGPRFELTTISHGNAAFTDGKLKSMGAAGMLHFGGHGHPERVDEGVEGPQARRLELAPCVAFNGACYTGVTGRWFEQWTADGNIAEKRVAHEESFCLNLLANQVLGYLAALHPDHGIPVYQEMEYLAYSGASLGDVMKHTYDGVVIAAGGKLPVLDPLAGGSPSTPWTPSEVMLKGTAARILFGDPALIVGSAFLEPPFDIANIEGDGAMRVTARLANTALKSTYTDTYHADLAWDPIGFNDRAFILFELPESYEDICGVEVASVEAGGKSLPFRLVGYGVESDGEARRLHVQVDVPTQGYMQSTFRAAGSKVELTISR
jgi:hypothetical protein